MRTIFLILTLAMPAFVNSFVTPKKKDRPNTLTYVLKLGPNSYFDPLRIAVNRNETTLKYLREAELQHGRVEMISFITLVELDVTFPKEVAINHLSALDALEQAPCWFGVVLFEVARISNGWIIPTPDIFDLDETYQPWNVFGIPESVCDEETINKELWNGRMAMLGCAKYIAQELVQQTNIVQTMH